jgi:hypothetical protein
MKAAHLSSHKSAKRKGFPCFCKFISISCKNIDQIVVGVRQPSNATWASYLSHDSWYNLGILLATWKCCYHVVPETMEMNYLDFDYKKMFSGWTLSLPNEQNIEKRSDHGLIASSQLWWRNIHAGKWGGRSQENELHALPNSKAYPR